MLKTFIHLRRRRAVVQRKRGTIHERPKQGYSRNHSRKKGGVRLAVIETPRRAAGRRSKKQTGGWLDIRPHRRVVATRLIFWPWAVIGPWRALSVCRSFLVPSPLAFTPLTHTILLYVCPFGASFILFSFSFIHCSFSFISVFWIVLLRLLFFSEADFVGNEGSCFTLILDP